MNHFTGIALIFGLVIGTGLFIYEYLKREEPYSYTSEPIQTPSSLSDSDINKKKQRKRKNFEYSTCPICFDPFIDGSQLSLLSCNHYYHTGCISKWLRQNNYDSVCPLCKQKHSWVKVMTYSSESS